MLRAEMSRVASLLGSALFLILAPGLVAGLVPYWLTRWRELPDFFPGAPILGWLLILFGAAVLLDSFFRFAWIGRGTPAPVAPTATLVVTGFYRFVRNPMYVAVTALNLGQALVFGSTPLLGYAAIIWLAFHAFVFFYEEPTLGARYGEQYATYRKHVPRWLPRLNPWRDQGD